MMSFFIKGILELESNGTFPSSSLSYIFSFSPLQALYTSTLTYFMSIILIDFSLSSLSCLSRFLIFYFLSCLHHSHPCEESSVWDKYPQPFWVQLFLSLFCFHYHCRLRQITTCSMSSTSSCFSHYHWHIDFWFLICTFLFKRSTTSHFSLVYSSWFTIIYPVRFFIP